MKFTIGNTGNTTQNKNKFTIGGSQQSTPSLPLERRFSQPNTALIQSAKPISFIPAHTVQKTPQPANYGAAWARGTLGKIPGKAITPLVEKLTGKKIDISTLPESNTFGEKAVEMIGGLGTELPLWMAGDMALIKPLSMLAKTAPVAKGLGFLPKAIQPALGTGVRAAATFGGPINALETVVNRDGAEGFGERLKEAPLMGLGGVALHGAGQLVGKGIKTGVDFKRFNQATKLPEINVNPLDDIQRAYRNPVSLRAAQAQQLNKTFSDAPSRMSPVKLKPLQQNIDEAVGVKKPLSNEMLRQRELDAQSAFGGPRKLKKGSFTTGEQRAFQELQEGITEAQNFTRHTDVLAPYPPGTTVQAAYADIKANTGIDLPKLLTNYERSQKVKGSLTEAERVMGRKAGVIPPLKQREGFPLQPTETPLSPKTIQKPAPLTWTNREVGEAGPLPIGSITSENLSQLPGQQLQPLRRPTANPATTPITPITQTPISQTPIQPRALTDDGTIRPQVDRKPAKRRSISEIIKEVRTQFVEDVAPIEKMERAVTGGIASAEKSIYKQSRLFRGSPEQSAEFVRSRITPVMKQVEKQGKTVEDIGDYALAIHARDVNAKGIVSGFSDERIANTIAMHGTPEMEAARLELMKINNELLDSLADAGVIEKSLVTVLREKHPNYMPLFRSFDDEKIEFGSEISKALANVSSPIERLKGSKRDVMDPVESMIKNIYKTISAVDRNKVAVQLGPLADKDASGLIVRRLAEGEEKSRLNSVYAMEGGKKVHYEVQPDVYKAIMGLDKESSLLLIKIFQQPASLLRAGATLTPEFSLRNPIRDIPAAFSVSNSGLNPVRDIPMALLDIIRTKKGKETLFNQFLKDNAGYGNIISTDRKVLQDAMKDALSKPDNRFMNVVNPKSWLRVLRAVADVSESATKLGEYRAALRSGVSRPEAAYRARDIMDFARAGTSVREANKIVAFLNANIQGKSKIYRSIKENPVGVTTRAFTSITVPTIGAFIAQKYLANDKQKAIIDNAEDWLTSTFWLLPVPGTDQVARIPKPFDFAPMFANLPERTLKYIFENDREAFDGFARQTLVSAALPTMISALTPLIEGFTNTSLFRQTPVIPQREKGLNFPDQYDIRTTETAKFIAKGVDKLTGGEGAFKNFGSPRIIDNTIRGFTAGLGTYVTSAIDLVAESTGVVDKKLKPARNVSELPLLRAFLVSDKSGGKSMDKIYSEKERLTREKGSAKLAEKDFAQGDRLGEISSVTSEISDISKEIREIENDRNISPESKRTRINALITRRNLLAKRIVRK